MLLKEKTPARTSKVPLERHRTKTANHIDWKCVFCNTVRKSARIPSVTTTIIRCKGMCYADTAHIALQ